MRPILVVSIFSALVACQPEQSVEPPTAPPPDPAPVVDMHTSQNSLDWAGRYEGLLACADCAGVHTQLTLERNGSFAIVTRPLARDAAAATQQGRFEWEPDGNTIVLDAAGDGQRFAVGEGRLTALAAGQSRPVPAAPNTVLAQWSPAWRDTGQDLASMLQDHRWTLVEATDAANQRIGALFPDPQRPFAFNFAESRLHVQGGCNGLRGGFQVDAGDQLSLTGMMSTMMACETPLMDADAALSQLLAAPLQAVPVGGMQPTLALVTPANDVLVLSGELTPEARFGSPTTIFFEIAAEAVACEESMRADGLCLQVRELRFDDQGLRVGTPTEWQAFSAEIEGYQHEPGIRNVVRVRRFQSAGESGTEDPRLYVLDLVVESEVVPR